MNKKLSTDTTAPATDKGLRAKTEIIRTASELLRQRSVAETRIQDVLEACGMGKSQFYHYFKDKEDLLRQIIHFRFEELFKPGILTPLEQVETLNDLRSWLRGRGEMFEKAGYFYGCPASTLSMQLPIDDDSLNVEVQDFLNEQKTALQAALKRIRANGQISESVNLKDTTTLIMAILQGGLTLSRVYRDPHQMKIVLKQADQLVKYLAVS